MSCKNITAREKERKWKNPFCRFEEEDKGKFLFEYLMIIQYLFYKTLGHFKVFFFWIRFFSSMIRTNLWMLILIPCWGSRRSVLLEWFKKREAFEYSLKVIIIWLVFRVVLKAIFFTSLNCRFHFTFSMLLNILAIIKFYLTEIKFEEVFFLLDIFFNS